MKTVFFRAAAAMLFSLVITRGVTAQNREAIQIINGVDLAINQTISLKTKQISNGKLLEATYSIKDGQGIAVISNDNLVALGQGKVIVVAEVAGYSCEKEFSITPYLRLCGAAVAAGSCCPVCAWVDFNQKTGEIVHVEVSGRGNSSLEADHGKKFSPEAQTAGKDFIGKTATAVIKASSTASGDIAKAVVDACKRYVRPSSFSIRNYQTMMTGRYLANNPYFEDLRGDRGVKTRIVAAYPEGCAKVVAEDVYNGSKLTWKGGLNSAEFKSGEKSHAVSHSVIQAIAPGLVLVEYSYKKETVLDAIEIFDNFTLGLSGSDSYGKVISGPSVLTEDFLVYRTLGDKAMNFPGGTAGPTVIDVTIDKTKRTIENVAIVVHSDSTYLANPWEYFGKFSDTGIKLYSFGSYLTKFKGLSADKPIIKYVLSTAKEKGGLPVDGGIVDVVTGATRTANAVIVGVNSALEKFAQDIPKTN